MKQSTAGALLVAAAVAGGLALAFPRINDVETGRTADYPDIQPRTYRASEAAVAKAAKETIESLSGFSLVGAGSGTGGSALQATATGPLPLESEVTIRVRSVKGQTVVTVRSKSPGAPWDLGQNARHVRAFLEALDSRVR